MCSRYGFTDYDVYPCSPLQEAMFSTSLEDPTAYVQQLVWNLTDKITKQQMFEAWLKVVEKYSVLRTSFVATSQRAYQIVFPQPRLSLEHKNGNLKHSLDELLNKGFQQGDSSWLSMTVVMDIETNQEYFVLQMHHCVYDGWCMDLYMRDFYKAYETKQLQGKSDFKPFIQFVQLQEQHLERFWKEYLKDFNPVTLFNAVKNQKETVETVQWNTKLDVTKDQVMQVCKRYNVTEACLFKTLLGITLQMYSQTNDVVFGEVVSGRDVPVSGIDQMGGPTISTIPTRIRCDSNMTLQELYSQVQKQHISRFDYSSVSVNQIESWIDIKPLIEILFVYQNNSLNDNPNQKLEPVQDENLSKWTQVSFPLEIEIQVNNEGYIMEGNVQNKNLESQAKQMMQQFQYLLKQVIENNESKLSVDNIRKPPTEVINELYQWGAGEKIPIQTTFVLDPFIEIATSNPELQALEQGDNKMTYGSLHSYSTNIKNYLLEKGVKTGDFIPIITSRCFGMLIGMFGILKAGAAYIPVDNSMPFDRIQTIIEEAQVNHILIDETSNQDLIEMCQNFCPITLLGPSVWEATYSTKTLNRLIEPTDPCLVIFTSGSTGKPKGIVISHISFANYILIMVPGAYRVSNYRIANVTSINFDSCHHDIFMALTHSSVLCLQDGDSFSVLKNVDVADITPSLMKLIDPLEYPRLKSMAVGGEPLEKPVLEKWLGNAKIYNTYGPSETTVMTLVKHCQQADKITIGKPLRNTYHYIVDDRLQLVPKGVKGELLIGGTGVAIGYLNRPDLTAEKFIPNHFLQDGSRMYRTGDVCRWTEDGEVEIFGRGDDQVKVNGYRIELNEVRDQLEHVTGAEVLKIDNKLVAFVTPASVDVEKIREAAMNKLPHYMIPSMFVPLDQFPLTGNGKVIVKLRIGGQKSIDQTGFESI